MSIKCFLVNFPHKAGNALDSITRSKMHREKAELQKEVSKYEKLAQLSAPAELSSNLQTVILFCREQLIMANNEIIATILVL